MVDDDDRKFRWKVVGIVRSTLDIVYFTAVLSASITLVGVRYIYGYHTSGDSNYLYALGLWDTIFFGVITILLVSVIVKLKKLE